MHHQYRLSVLQWNPGPARRTPTKIIAASRDRFHAVILPEASDHVPRVSDRFTAYTGDTDLAISLNRDTFEPYAAVFAIHESSSSKDTWGVAALVVRGLLRRRSISGTPTVTFCCVHNHNVVAKKRDASTDLRRRPHAHMAQNDVVFIGGDFNMSAFSTVGDVFTDREFSAPGNSLLWGLGALNDSCRERTGVSHCAQAPVWRVDSHGCYKVNNADLALGPPNTTAHFPSFLHLRTTNFPGPDNITRSEQALQRRLSKHERRPSRRRLAQPSAPS